MGHVKRSCGPSESSAKRHSHITPLSSVDVWFFKSPDGGVGRRTPSGGDYLNKFEAHSCFIMILYYIYIPYLYMYIYIFIYVYIYIHIYVYIYIHICGSNNIYLYLPTTFKRVSYLHTTCKGASAVYPPPASPARKSQLFPDHQEGVSYLPTTCKR